VSLQFNFGLEVTLESNSGFKVTLKITSGFQIPLIRTRHQVVENYLILQ